MSRHVLLCDDEVAIVRAAEIKLSRAGYRVTCCFNGAEALEAVGRDRPDLLITDCQMPRMGGLELLRRLREIESCRDLPAFMLTAKGLELPHDELREKLGVLRVCAKPFSPRELLKAVDDLFVASAP